MEKHQICNFCIMDTTDPEIIFDNSGICNHCKSAKEKIKKGIIEDLAKRKIELEKLVKKIKYDGKNKKYDCVIGISGGVDSTYVALKIKEFGLNPLAVHVDNGWNSKLSSSNIEKVINILDIDLQSYLLDWDEFKNLQRAFLKASVPDLEIPTDHAINAVLIKTALENDVKYLISGTNINTESILPRVWSYGHSDWKYINTINRLYGNKELRKFPHYTFKDQIINRINKKYELVSILDYFDFKKNNAITVLENKLGWKYYGGKHFESIYTRFVQGYILPKKFNFDKKRAHLSSLIVSGEISREEALKEMSQNEYTEDLIQEDKKIILNKLEITKREFEDLMLLPNKTFWNYSSDETSSKYYFIKNAYKIWKNFKKIIKSEYGR